eukprot:6313272-Amphidinium_carterae.1
MSNSRKPAVVKLHLFVDLFVRNFWLVGLTSNVQSLKAAACHRDTTPKTEHSLLLDQAKYKILEQSGTESAKSASLTGVSREIETQSSMQGKSDAIQRKRHTE